MANRKSNLTNAFETTLSAEMSGVAGSMSLTDATGLTDPFYIVIEPDSPTQREYVYVSSLAGSVATVSERYLSGSAAGSGLTHPIGSTVRMAAFSQNIEDLHDRADDLQAQINASGDHGSLAGLPDDDHTQYHTDGRAATWHTALSGDHVTGGDAHTHVQTILIGEAGELTTKTGTFRWYAPFNLTLQRVTANVAVAPTGAAVEVDVNKNGTTIFTTQSNRPIIAASGFFDASGTPDVTSMTKDTDYLTFDIDQIGSTLPGEDLTIAVEYVAA